MDKFIDTQFVESFKAELAKNNNIVILAHKNPDGDALGSGLALYNYLVQVGKNPVFIVPNQLPIYLHWMPAAQQIVIYKSMKEKAIKLLNNADMVIMVDFNAPSRIDELGNLLLENNKPKFLIDHHPNPEPMANYTYSRTSASSTAEMVFELLHSLNNGQVLSQTVAGCLLTGITTDTGSFSYNSSSPFTFNVVSELLKSGVDKNYIIDKLYDNFSENRLRLFGYTMYQKMVVLPKYKTAYITLSQAELEKFGYQSGDTEGFVNYPLSIEGIIFSAIFMERDGLIRCSFRSKGVFPANAVAETYFNGGGHLNAAGGESRTSINETVKLFESVLDKYVNFIEP